jgi:two-component system nitrate/nitrite response regulator NarL
MRRPYFATVLIGSSALLREGLARILRAANFRIAASSSTVEDFLLNPSSPNQSILLVIDVGNETHTVSKKITRFKNQYPAARIAVVCHSDHLSRDIGNDDLRRDICAAFRAGANAYFVNVASCDTFIKSLELIALGETILPSAILSCLPGHENEMITRDVDKTPEVLIEANKHFTPQLSAREKTILRCLIEGNSNKAIARKFDIAEATVKVHVKCILRKIRVNNRTQAAIWAMNNDSLILEMDRRGMAEAKIVTCQPGRAAVRPVPRIPELEPPPVPSNSELIEGTANAELPSIDHFARIGVARRNH